MLYLGYILLRYVLIYILEVSFNFHFNFGAPNVIGSKHSLGVAWISSNCFDRPLMPFSDVTTTRKPGIDFDWSLSKHCIIMNFSGIVTWYLADRIGGMHFDNLYQKQQIALFFET